MMLGNMRELGVRNLIAYCLNDACRHQALIDVSSYPAETEVPSFGRRVVCAKCGSCPVIFVKEERTSANRLSNNHDGIIGGRGEGQTADAGLVMI